MRGWHAHNGVSLNNPRLGFVCTAMTTDGAPGLEGYYREFDHDLTEDQRLQFAPDETCPPIDPVSMPILDATSWPAQRQAKANLNYAMEYVRNAFVILESLLGVERAMLIGGICARQIGMHNADSLATAFDCSLTGHQSFCELLAAMLSEDGSQVDASATELTLTDWRFQPIDQLTDASVQIFTEALRGMLSVRDRFASLDYRREQRTIVWTVNTSACRS